MQNKRNLLVTLADKNYIQQAKQLFSSVYWNAGWNGEYMLLAHEIPDEELAWFKDKGILIKKCTPLRNYNIGKGHSPVVLDKFYLFTTDFKGWKHIVFLDSDIIVKGSLDYLIKIKGFGAANSTINLGRQFSPENMLYDEIKRDYNIHIRSFNSGVISFPTDIINDDLFDKLTGLYTKFESIAFSDESILNLYYYKKWIKIPRVFNNLYITFFLLYSAYFYKTRSVVFHFMGNYINEKYLDAYKPWDTRNPFYKEWLSNLERAEQMDLSIIRKTGSWWYLKIKLYSFLINTIAWIKPAISSVKHSKYRYKIENFIRYVSLPESRPFEIRV
ncbi:MAG: glycosyltransferase [Bacteroidales bacterium]|nr:glycosyltransferase [Bacteroidales bacterium]